MVSHSNEEQVRGLLQQWATQTRKGQLDHVLDNHASDVLIFDVLAPMKYEGAAAYRASWGDWQPDVAGEGQFVLEDLVVTAGEDIAYAHAFIRCGGTMPNGKTFEDLVRATFCANKIDGAWKITHQHISKAIQPK